MRLLPIAFLLFPALPVVATAAESPASFSEPAALLLNLSERDLNRIAVDSFHANGGPRFGGEKARVSSSVADLRYNATLSNPVVRLGNDRTAHLSLDVLDASVRIGHLKRKLAGRDAQCENAGLDVDPGRPLAVDLALDLAIENGGLRIVPRNVEIPDVAERLQLVKPTRCTNALFPRWFLWWLGKPYFRRSIANLDEILLKRARVSAARFEAREGLLLNRRWGSDLHFSPGTVDTSGGSLLVGLTASSGEAAGGASLPRDIDGRASLPYESFVGVSESLVNEIAKRVVARRSGAYRQSSVNFRKLLKSNAVYALVPGLRKIGSKDNIYFEVSFGAAPRFEFSSVEAGGPASKGNQALIRVLLSDVDINIRRSEDKGATLLGTLRVDSGRMAVVPFTNLLGGISFRMAENQWRVSSTGLEFDEELVAATLQEVTFGKIFETSYAPLLTRELRLGRTDFSPRSFAVINGYLIIGLGEPPPDVTRYEAAATRTETLPGSR